MTALDSHSLAPDELVGTGTLDVLPKAAARVLACAVAAG